MDQEDAKTSAKDDALSRTLSRPTHVGEWDVFISYRHGYEVNDNVAAIRAGLELELQERFDHSLRVFLDQSDIRNFDDWMVRCYRALRSSRFFLVCISPMYLESEACRWEWDEWKKREMMAGHIGSAAGCIWLCDSSDLKTSFHDERASLRVRELSQRHSFTLSGWRLGQLSEQTKITASGALCELADYIAARLRLFSLTREQNGNVRLPSEQFVGRIDELSRIAALFPRSHSKIVGLSGVGGIGKSSLAFRYAFDHADEYPGGRWLVSAKECESIATAIRPLRFDLGIEIDESEKGDDILVGQKILARLRQRGRVLLILDDVDKSALLVSNQTAFLPTDDSVHVLFTTQLGPSAFPKLHSAILTVDKLAKPDVINLIRQHQPGKQFATLEDESAVGEIARELDGLTIAVETAAIYLGRYAPGTAPPEKVVTIPQYIARLRQDLAPDFMERLRLSTSSRDADMSSQMMSQLTEISAVTQATFERLSYEAGTVMGLASLLPPACIVLEWLRSCAAEFHSELRENAIAGKLSPWDDLLGQLLSQHLISPTTRPDVFVMHPLLQAAFRQLLENDLDALETVLVQKILADFASTKNDWRNSEINWKLDAFGWISRRWASEMLEPGIELAARVGTIYRSLGEYSKAEELLRHALRYTRPNDGPTRQGTGVLVMVLASILKDTGRAREAAELLSVPQPGSTVLQDNTTVSPMPSLEPILKTLSGLSHPEHAAQLGDVMLNTITARNEPSLVDDVISNFAIVGPSLKEQGRGHEAEALLWLALGIAESAYGPGDIKTALPRNNLGQYLLSVDKLEKAEQLLRQNVEVSECGQQTSSPAFAVALHNLGLVLNRLGKPLEAEGYGKRGLDLLEQALGDNHPDLAPLLAGIASALGGQGKHKEALVFLRRQFVLLARFMSDTGQQHTYLERAFGDYANGLLLAGYTGDAITSELEEAAKEGGLTGLKLR